MTIPNVVVSMPSQLFTLANSFNACANGSIYVGQIGADPTLAANQIQVYVENSDGTFTAVSQPITINAGGYPVYAGQVAKFVTIEGQSMAVLDSLGVQQFYFPDLLGYDPDQLRQQLITGIGSDLVGYLPNGGANTKTVKSKLMTLDETDDFSTPLVAFNNSARIISPNAHFNNIIPIPSGTKVDASKSDSSINGTNIAFTLQVNGNNITIRNVTFSGETNNFITIAANSDATIISNNRLTANGVISSSKIGINVTNTGTNRTLINGNMIEAAGYGILINNTINNFDSIIMSDNIVKGGSDGIAINDLSSNGKNALINNNIVSAGIGRSGVTSGFGISISGVAGHITNGNIVKESRNEGLHVEDSQSGGIITSNLFANNQNDGSRILNETNAKPLILSNNYFMPDPTTFLPGNYGIRFVNDTTGTLNNCSVVGNISKGFNTGAALGGSNTVVFDANVILESSNGIATSGGASTKPMVIIGDNLVDASNIALSTTSGNQHYLGHIGLLNSDSTIIFKSTTTSHPGNSLCGSFHKNIVGVTHPGGGATTIAQLFDMNSANCFDGKLLVSIGNNSAVSSAVACFNIVWDGITLTSTRSFLKNTGVLTGALISQDLGKLNFGLSSSTAITLNVFCEFIGIYYEA